MKALDLSTAKTIDYLTAERMIREGSSGYFFRVEFVKRSDGSYRRMVARVGVPPQDPRKGQRRYRAGDYGLLTVWEPANGSTHNGQNRDDGFRSIPIEGIRALRIGGRTYAVTAPKT